MTSETLHSYLERVVDEPTLADLIDRVASACWSVSRLVRQAAVDEQRLPTLLSEAQDAFVRSCKANPHVARLVSLHDDQPVDLGTSAPGGVVVGFDPLEGSSNLEADVPVGSIFAIWQAEPAGHAALSAKQGRLLCSGYALYGLSTVFVITLGETVEGFSLDQGQDTFVLTHPDIRVPQQMQDRETAVAVEPSPCFGQQSLSVVGEVHRVLLRGGMFLYPLAPSRSAQASANRWRHKADIIAMLVETARGAASHGIASVPGNGSLGLDSLGPVVFGSSLDVRRLLDVDQAS